MADLFGVISHIVHITYVYKCLHNKAVYLMRLHFYLMCLHLNGLCRHEILIWQNNQTVFQGILQIDPHLYFGSHKTSQGDVVTSNYDLIFAIKLMMKVFYCLNYSQKLISRSAVSSFCFSQTSTEVTYYFFFSILQLMPNGINSKFEASQSRTQPFPVGLG